MQILSQTEFEEWCSEGAGVVSTSRPTEAADELWMQIPKDSGRKTALARLVAKSLLGNGPTVLHFTEWSVWPSSENMDLFLGYRDHLGERRGIAEAPIHICESTDSAALTSLVCLGLYFVWGMELFNLDDTFAVSFSHDEYLTWRIGSQASASRHEVIQLLQPFADKTLYEKGTR